MPRDADDADPEALTTAEGRRSRIGGILKTQADRMGLLSRTELAKLLNIDKSTVTRTFKGEIAPHSKNMLMKWIKVLRIRGGDRQFLIAAYQGEADDLATVADLESTVGEARDSLKMHFTEALDSRLTDFSGTLVDLLSPLVRKKNPDGEQRSQEGDAERQSSAEGLQKTLDEMRSAIQSLDKLPQMLSDILREHAEGTRESTVEKSTLQPEVAQANNLVTAYFEAASGLPLIPDPLTKDMVHRLKSALPLALRLIDCLEGLVPRLQSAAPELQAMHPYYTLAYSHAVLMSMGAVWPFVRDSADPAIKAPLMNMLAAIRTSQAFAMAAIPIARRAGMPPEVISALEEWARESA